MSLTVMPCFRLMFVALFFSTQNLGKFSQDAFFQTHWLVFIFNTFFWCKIEKYCLKIITNINLSSYCTITLTSTTLQCKEIAATVFPCLLDGALTDEDTDFWPGMRKLSPWSFWHHLHQDPGASFWFQRIIISWRKSFQPA